MNALVQKDNSYLRYFKIPLTLSIFIDYKIILVDFSFNKMPVVKVNFYKKNSRISNKFL